MCDVSDGEDVSFGAATRTFLRNMLFPVIVIGAPYCFDPGWKHVVRARKSVSLPCFVLDESSVHPHSASAKSDRNRVLCAVLHSPAESWQLLCKVRSPKPRQRVPLASPEPIRFLPKDRTRTILVCCVDQNRLDRTPVFQ